MTELLASTYFCRQKPIFAGKKYFCQSGFYHGKNGFSTFWQKPANPGLYELNSGTVTSKFRKGVRQQI